MVKLIPMYRQGLLLLVAFTGSTAFSFSTIWLQNNVRRSIILGGVLLHRSIASCMCKTDLCYLLKNLTAPEGEG